jgi:Fic family protein
VRSFIDLDRQIGRVPAGVVRRLSTIDIGRGSERLYRHQVPGLLTGLAKRARIESVTASSAIEGVIVPDAGRADRIINHQVTSLRTRSEQELAGYRDAQDYLIREDWRPLNIGLLLHLHRLLFAYTAIGGGRLKGEDNLVVDRDENGIATVRFRPVSARDTPQSLVELIERYGQASDSEAHHPVLLVGLFVLDFLVIHPFTDGNGRVGRLVTHGLLADAGYCVGQYVSLEASIAQSAEQYYAALLASTHGWHDGESDPWPWLEYFVAILASAYDIFADRAGSQLRLEGGSGSKQERVRDYVLRHGPGHFTIAEARAALPGVSDGTIRLVFDELRDAGQLEVDGVGRAARWHRLG